MGNYRSDMDAFIGRGNQEVEYSEAVSLQSLATIVSANIPVLGLKLEQLAATDDQKDIMLKPVQSVAVPVRDFYHRYCARGDNNYAIFTKREGTFESLQILEVKHGVEWRKVLCDPEMLKQRTMATDGELTLSYSHKGSDRCIVFTKGNIYGLLKAVYDVLQPNVRQ